MAEYFIRYKRETLAEVARMTGPSGTFAVQQLNADDAIILVSADSYQLPLLDVPVAEVQAQQWNWCKAIRAKLQVQPMTTTFGVVQATPTSLGHMALQAVRALGAPGATFSWTMADDSIEDLTSAEMVSLFGQVSGFIDTVHQYSQSLRAALFAPGVTTEDALRVDIFNGWPDPANFQPEQED